MTETEIGYCSSLVGVRAKRLYARLRALAAVHGVTLTKDYRRDFDMKLHVDCAPNPGSDAWKKPWVQVSRRPYRVYAREGTPKVLEALANVAMGLVQLEDLEKRPRKR